MKHSVLFFELCSYGVVRNLNYGDVKFSCPWEKSCPIQLHPDACGHLWNLSEPYENRWISAVHPHDLIEKQTNKYFTWARTHINVIWCYGRGFLELHLFYHKTKQNTKGWYRQFNVKVKKESDVLVSKEMKIKRNWRVFFWKWKNDKSIWKNVRNGQQFSWLGTIMWMYRRNLFVLAKNSFGIGTVTEVMKRLGIMSTTQ